MLSGALRRRKSGVSCRALRKEIHNDKKKSKLTHVVLLAQMPYTSIPAQYAAEGQMGRKSVTEWARKAAYIV